MRSTPLVYGLLIINILVSAYALYVDKGFFQQSLFNIGAVIKERQYYRIITSSFLHGSLMHLAFNMLTLFFLGPYVEYVLGSLFFFVLYFGSQLTSMLATFIVRHKEPDYSSIGASGAVSGVVLSYCTFEPFSLLYFFGIVPLPAIAVAVGYVLYSSVLMRSNGRIAHEAHLGGALGGIVITLAIRPDLLFG